MRFMPAMHHKQEINLLPHPKIIPGLRLDHFNFT